MKQNDTNRLSLAETIVLLALNDKGWFGSSETRIRFGLAGALMFELEQQGLVRILHNVVEVQETGQSRDKMADAALECLRKSKKTLTLKKAIQRLVFKSGIKWKLPLKSLIRKQIIRRETFTILRFIYQDKYPLVDADRKDKIVVGLISALIENKEVSGADLMLLSVMRNCRMISKNFLKREHFLTVRRRIFEITDFREAPGEPVQKIGAIHKATRKAIRASKVMVHV